MSINYLCERRFFLMKKVRTYTKPDYINKSRLMQTDICKKLKTIDRRNYLETSQGIIEDVSFDCAFEEMMLLMEGFTEEDIKEGRRINNASYQRSKRLKEKIAKYLQLGKCVFATLTFEDRLFNETSEETRRRYVARFLKSQSDYYIANIDYGKENHREHYHAIIVSDNIDKGAWSYGYDYYEKIRCDNLSAVKVGKYISKLTNHAIKETTKRCCYIYSRLPKSETA